MHSIEYYYIGLCELAGTGFRGFLIALVSSIVYNASFDTHKPLPTLVNFMPVVLAVWLSVWLTCLAFPKQKFDPLLSILTGKEASVTVVEILGQGFGAVIGACLAFLAVGQAHLYRTYMICGGLYYQQSTFRPALLPILASEFVVAGVLMARGRKMKSSLRASIIAGIYATAALLCYQIGGYVDSTRWLASNLVRQCWTLDDLDATIDGLQTGWFVYFFSPLIGGVLGYQCYRLVFHLGEASKPKVPPKED